MFSPDTSCSRLFRFNFRIICPHRYRAFPWKLEPVLLLHRIWSDFLAQVFPFNQGLPWKLGPGPSKVAVCNQTRPRYWCKIGTWSGWKGKFFSDQNHQAFISRDKSSRSCALFLLASMAKRKSLVNRSYGISTKILERSTFVSSLIRVSFIRVHAILRTSSSGRVV